MPIDPEFLKILVCPQTRQPLREASAEELERVNAGIRAGRIHNRGGESVSDELVEGLVPSSADAVYPVRDGIPILLPHEAIVVDADSADASADGGSRDRAE